MSKVEYLVALAVIIVTLVVAIVIDSGLVVFLGLIVSAIIAFGRGLFKSKANGTKKKMSSLQTLCFVASILSIFCGTIWYLALSLAIISLIKSVELIKETGGRAPKATMILAIIGIVNCVNIYLFAISLILSEV